MFKAKDIMNADVIAIAPNDSADDAMALMLRYEVSGLAVVDQSGNLLGVLSEYDLLGLVWDCESAGDNVSSYMSANVCTVGEEASWIEVADLFLSKRIRLLPVVRGKRLLGIITRYDLIRQVVGVRQQIERSLARANLADR